MLTPTIHINGTSRDALIDAAIDARAAVREAKEALRGVAPNGRDYYPQGADAIRQASEGWQNMHRALESVEDELLALIEEMQEPTKR
jgi:hypothetical protein